MAQCDPNTLMEEAKCFDCLDDRQMRLAIIQLLCDLSAGGGGGGSISVSDEGVVEVDPATNINFVGAGVSVADGGGGSATVTIPGGGSGVDVEDEGVPVATASTLNFIGDAVQATTPAAGVVDVTITAYPYKQFFVNAGNPNGVVTATGPAQCYDSVNNQTLVKITPGTSNNEWA
jgi:hypothetical protein